MDRRDDPPNVRPAADEAGGGGRPAEADRELRLAELDTIYSSGPLGLAALDRELRYVHVNERLAEINGVGVADHLGRTVRDVVPDLADTLELLAARVFETAEPVTGYELTGVTASHPGVQRVWLEQWLPLKDAGGVVTGILVLVEEITDRKRAEENLRESQRDYESMFESSTVGMAQADPATRRFTRVNRALAEMTGYSIDELCRMSWNDLTHPDDRRRDAEALAPLLEGSADRWTIEKRYLRKDGSIIWVNVAGTVVRGGKGELRRTIAVIKDITARKHAEEAAREQARILDAYFHCSVTPLALLDRDFNFVRVNEAYAAADQLEAAEFPGRNHFELYPSAENEAIFRGVVASRQPYRTSARPFSFPNHPERGVTYWDWILTPLLDGTGEVEFLVFALEDVTARVLAERKRREANERLASHAAQLRALAAELTVAEQHERQRLAALLHDHVQQLLVAAKYRARLLERSRDEETRSGVGEIMGLLDECIDASRSLTAEISPPILREGTLREGLEWLARWMADKHGLGVELSVETDASPVAENVRVLVFEAVRELLFNVAKHSGTRSAAVRLRLVEDDELQVVVSDEGRGFDPQAAMVGQALGRGFGLVSIGQRVGLVDGRFEVDSAVGKGSRFSITVPIGGPTAAAHPAPPPVRAAQPSEAPPPEHPPASRTRVRVLLVDDHAVFRQGLAHLLGNEADLEVVGEAADGQEAIEMAATLVPDVILMDVSMPAMSGIDATRLILQARPDVRVIGLSMFEERERAEAMQAAGACAYVTKTAPAADLVATIRASVRSSDDLASRAERAGDSG